MGHAKKKRNTSYLKETPIQEIADALGVSCTRIHQIERGALRKIRDGLRERGYDGAELFDLPRWLIAQWLETFLKPQDPSELSNSVPANKPASNGIVRPSSPC